MTKIKKQDQSSTEEKREWAKPTITRSSEIGRVRGGTTFTNVEAAYYSPS